VAPDSACNFHRSFRESHPKLLADGIMAPQFTQNLYDRITRQIIEAIETGAGTYQMPWNNLREGHALPSNPVGKYQYHGINVLGLWASQQLRAFTTGHWATYRQWASIGAQVRKGEKGSPTVFFQPSTPSTPDEHRDHEDQASSRRQGARPFIAKLASVFNADQVDGFHRENTPPPLDQKHEQAESVIAQSGARILWGGDAACYLPSRDEIHLPPPVNFVSAEAYYSVAFHELTHWTGHTDRCARDLAGRFGSSAYAMEELIAELGAAFMAAEVGISQEPRIDHAQYINSWLDVLQQDARAIFTAASKASDACRFLLQNQTATDLHSPSSQGNVAYPERPMLQPDERTSAC
jgi:antirestriction protein ArdC